MVIKSYRRIITPEGYMPASMRRLYIACIVVSISFVGFESRVAGATQERDVDSKFATWAVTGTPVTVYPAIAAHEVKLSTNEIAPFGFPIGDPLFVIQPGEIVDIMEIFPNGGESGHTCKVRNHALKQGFVICPAASSMKWLDNDRGALLRILLERPSEYEGNLAGPIRDMEKLRDFISQHKSSRYLSSARLMILSVKCSMTLDLVQDVWEDLRYLKEFGEVRGKGAKINLKWTSEASRLYASLKKQEDGRLQEILDLCSLVGELQNSVPSPVSRVEE